MAIQLYVLSQGAPQPDFTSSEAVSPQVLDRHWWLGALYNLVATLDLKRISLGGSVFWHQRDWLLPRLQTQLKQWLPALTDGVELVPAGLGLDLGDYAALALVS